eukprot:842387-Rhodomonas_salina.1
MLLLPSHLSLLLLLLLLLRRCFLLDARRLLLLLLLLRLSHTLLHTLLDTALVFLLRRLLSHTLLHAALFLVLFLLLLLLAAVREPGSCDKGGLAGALRQPRAPSSAVAATRSRERAAHAPTRARHAQVCLLYTSPSPRDRG